MSNLKYHVMEMMKLNQILIAFNVFNEDSIEAVIRAAEKVNRPVAIEVNEEDLDAFGLDGIVSIAKRKIREAKVPVILHLDHGKSFKLVAKCIQAGFDSVMFDPTDLNEEDKIPEVRSLMKFSKAIDLTVESMVGHLQLALDEENTDEELTDPIEARKFVSETKIDLLAVSVGTEHGSYVVGKEAAINFEQLKKIQEQVSIPMVVHGGSGVPESQLRLLRTFNVGKMNIGSAIRVAYKQALMDIFSDNPLSDIQEAREFAKEKMYQVALEKLKILSL